MVHAESFVGGGLEIHYTQGLFETFFHMFSSRGAACSGTKAITMRNRFPSRYWLSAIGASMRERRVHKNLEMKEIKELGVSEGVEVVANVGM